MKIKEQLMNDMKAALKAHESLRLGVVRFLLAEIKNQEIEKGELTEENIQQIIASQAKKTKEALVDFQKAQRQDLVDQEKEKINLMESYLPAQISDEELEAIVRAEIAQLGENKNPGQLIGATMKKVAGRADGSRVSALVQKLLM